LHPHDYIDWRRQDKIQRGPPKSPRGARLKWRTSTAASGVESMMPRVRRRKSWSTRKN